MADNLACCIDDLTNYFISTYGYRNDQSTDIFLERLYRVGGGVTPVDTGSQARSPGTCSHTT